MSSNQIIPPHPIFGCRFDRHYLSDASRRSRSSKIIKKQDVTEVDLAIIPIVLKNTGLCIPEKYLSHFDTTLTSLIFNEFEFSLRLVFYFWFPTWRICLHKFSTLVSREVWSSVFFRDQWQYPIHVETLAFQHKICLVTLFISYKNEFYRNIQTPG